MTSNPEEEAVTKEIYREFISNRFPEYLPYFELLWKEKDQPVRIKKTRGLETLAVNDFILPFLAHFAAYISAHYVGGLIIKKYVGEKKPNNKIKTRGSARSSSPSAGMIVLREIPEEKIDDALKETRSKFPGISDEDYGAIEKSAKTVLKSGS